MGFKSTIEMLQDWLYYKAPWLPLLTVIMAYVAIMVAIVYWRYS